MTGQQALQVLQKPVFGDERCIQAKAILENIEALKAARKWAIQRGLRPAVNLKKDPLPTLDHCRIDEELDFWRNCGYEVNA